MKNFPKLKANKPTISFSLLLLQVFSELKHFPSLTLPSPFPPLALPFPSFLTSFLPPSFLSSSLSSSFLFLPSSLPLRSFLFPPFLPPTFLPPFLLSSLLSSLPPFLSSSLPSSLLFLLFASFLPPSFPYFSFLPLFFSTFFLSLLLPFLFLPPSFPPFLSLPFFLPCFCTFLSSLTSFHPNLMLCLGDEQFKGNICRFVLLRVGSSAVHKLVSLFPSSFIKCVSYLQRWPLDKKIWLSFHPRKYC